VAHDHRTQHHTQCGEGFIHIRLYELFRESVILVFFYVVFTAEGHPGETPIVILIFVILVSPVKIREI
jgi:hypothetical protein